MRGAHPGRRTVLMFGHLLISPHTFLSDLPNMGKSRGIHVRPLLCSAV